MKNTPPGLYPIRDLVVSCHLLVADGECALIDIVQVGTIPHDDSSGFVDWHSDRTERKPVSILSQVVFQRNNHAPAVVNGPVVDRRLSN